MPFSRREKDSSRLNDAHISWFFDERCLSSMGGTGFASNQGLKRIIED
jgi:hypothetical protein